MPAKLPASRAVDFAAERDPLHPPGQKAELLVALAADRDSLHLPEPLVDSQSVRAAQSGVFFRNLQQRLLSSLSELNPLCRLALPVPQVPMGAIPIADVGSDVFPASILQVW